MRFNNLGRSLLFSESPTVKFGDSVFGDVILYAGARLNVKALIPKGLNRHFCRIGAVIFSDSAAEVHRHGPHRVRR